MSFYGFKKQFTKTSQYLNEKIAGNKGSQLDEDYVDLEKKVDVINSGIGEIHNKTKEYLQPNPNARTRLAMQASYQKVRGQQRSVKYPQPEFNLGDALTRTGAGLNDDSPYCEALNELGRGFSELSEIKDAMELNVSQNFLEPLYQIQQKDLKEITHHRKKLESRRLDYDYKKNKGAKASEEELQAAEEKFEESKELSYNSMMNFMESDVEHIGQLHSFAEAVRDYHQQCAEIMETIAENLSEKLSEAASRPRQERTFISRPKFEDTGSSNSLSVSEPTPMQPSAQPRASLEVPTPAPAPAPAAFPSARALYDFDPENEGELEFKESDVIELTGRIDENWLEGRCNGKAGYFPENYVEILVPL